MTEAAPAAPEATITPDAAAPATPAPDASAAPEAQPADGGTDKPDAAPEKTFSQAELDRIVERARQKESRRAERFAYERVRRELAEKELERLRGGTSDGERQARQGPGDRPRQDQFKDWDAYQEALTDWKVEVKLAERAEREAKQSRVVREQAGRAEYADAVRSKLAEGAEKYDDFEEVVGAEGLPFTAPMVDALIRTPAPADVAYFLGQNPKEAHRIARLPLAEQVFAIRELADKLTKPPAPTKAPEPIKPTSGAAAGIEPSLEAVAGNYKEWKRLRERQLAQKS